MYSASEAESAKTFETLAALLGDDGKALDVYRSIPSVDITEPLAMYCGKVSDATDIGEDEILSVWRSVRSAFEREKDITFVISEESPHFPLMKGDFFPFIYLAGKESFLSESYVAVIGSPRPSMQAKSDTLEAVSELVASGAVIISPVEPGVPAFALQLAMRLGGKAIGVLASPISKCTSEAVLPLQRELYGKGLLMTPFSPYRKTEKWFQKIRNGFLSSIVSAALLVEERDGGPSWTIADSCLGNGKLMIPESAASNPVFSWMGKRAQDGALIYRKPKDVCKLIEKKRRESYPDLFS